MRKLYFILALLICNTTMLLGNPVDVNTASTVASKFLSHKTNVKSTPSLAYTYKQGGHVCAYLFNDNKHLVVVAADDIAHPILGFTDENTFDSSNISPELNYYLNTLSREIAFGIDNGIEASAEIEEEWRSVLHNGTIRASKGTPVVGPLVKTRWNQNAKYNKFCPEDPAGPGGHVYAGCVALAMAQVTKFFNAPIRGYGEMSYYHYVYGTQYANFGETVYEWDKMPVSLSAASDEEIDAVALLVYHLGVAVGMDYSPSGSGAVTSSFVEFLPQYFGFENTCYFDLRDYYSYDQWVGFLKENLDLNMPMIYDGHGDDGGHAFVCDGYDDNDYFHFNWGWGGSGDGYFLVDALNPSSMEFNWWQGAIFKAKPITNIPVTITVEPTEAAEVFGEGSFDYGATADIFLLHNKGWKLQGVYNGDDLVSSAVDFSVIVREPTSLVAKFIVDTNPADDYAVRVTANPAELGTVKGYGRFLNGSTTTVTAIPNDGIDFVSWTENGVIVSENTNYEFVVTKDRNLVANFDYHDYVITLDVIPADADSLHFGEGTYHYGDVVTIGSLSPFFYKFDEWVENNKHITYDSIFTWNVTRDANFVAKYALKLFWIRTSANDPNMGQIFGSGQYEYGEEAVLTAKPREDYSFEYWTEGEDTISFEQVLTVPVTHNRSFVAHFGSHVGLEEQLSDAIRLFPNPANKTINLNLPANKQAQIVIYNLSGQAVFNGTTDDEEISFDLAKGVYFININIDNQSFTKKFVIY